MTAGQEQALRELWPRFGCKFTGAPLNLETLFGRSAPCLLEIGFGNGETLVEQARRNPEQNFLGVEVHEPGIGHCLLHIDASAVENVRLIRHDAHEVMEHALADDSLERINLYFPDPWPKKRHHKRRIVNADFLQLCARKLAKGGHLHIATDWSGYAEHIDEKIAQSQQFVLTERREHDGSAPLQRPNTKFEKRGLKKGHRIFDWQLGKI